jgi:hypothetical protein
MPENFRVQSRVNTDKVIERVGLTRRNFERIKVKELTDNQRAKILKVTLSALTGPIVLTAGKPRSGKNFLTFFSAMMVSADPQANGDFALFSSAFLGVTNPSVQLEFEPIKQNAQHLVEFNVTLNDPSKTYKFRVFQYPLDAFQDISPSGSQVITALIPPIADFSGPYGASITQQNKANENAGWVLHSVRITSVG